MLNGWTWGISVYTVQLYEEKGWQWAGISLLPHMDTTMCDTCSVYTSSQEWGTGFATPPATQRWGRRGPARAVRPESVSRRCENTVKMNVAIPTCQRLSGRKHCTEHKDGLEGRDWQRLHMTKRCNKLGNDPPTLWKMSE